MGLINNALPTWRMEEGATTLLDKPLYDTTARRQPDPTAKLVRIKDDAVRVLCPYCGKIHVHGPIEHDPIRHRQALCDASKGYFISEVIS